MAYREVDEIVGWAHDGAAYCPDHKPHPDAHPIFLGDEWDEAPCCDVCREEIDVTVVR